MRVPKRKFGWTVVEVPVIGQGAWKIDEADAAGQRRAVETLRLGLDLGMTHIDTAEAYGRSEDLVGEAIAGRRDEVFVVSKVWPKNASFEGTLQACERSLKRLKTNRLDLYLLHWPSKYPIQETMRAMEKLVAEKLVRFIGVSNFDVRQVQEAERALEHERLACNQVEYHLQQRSIETRLLPYCAEREIVVMGYSPFGHGSFPAADTIGGKELERIGKRHGHTPRQVALNFLTRHPGVFTIPKATKLEHAQENSGGTGWELTPDDLAAIDRSFPFRSGGGS